MLGDPVLINLTGVSFLLSAETGCIIQSSDREVEATWKDIFDASKGYDVGSVVFNPKASISFDAYLNGTTGLAIAQPGVALTLANTLGVGTNQNGVSAGATYCRTVKISHQTEDLRKVSGTAIQRGAVT